MNETKRAGVIVLRERQIIHSETICGEIICLKKDYFACFSIFAFSHLSGSHLFQHREIYCTKKYRT